MEWVSTDRITGITSFVSNDKLYCAEAHPREAESALAVRKAAPLGGLFNATFGVAGLSCAQRGYVHGGLADSCTPSVRAFFKDIDGEAAFNTSLKGALHDYASRYSLEDDVSRSMSACSCQPDSNQFKSANCSALHANIGSWVHRDPWNGRELMCDEGPFIYATRALSVLKSSPQLAMHFRDQISPVSCAHLGFPELYPPEDHCYPQLRVWTRTNIHSDQGVKESEAVEQNLTTGGFLEFMRRYSQDDLLILNNDLSCNCLPTSSVGRHVAEFCKSEAHSPVRDWWSGDGIAMLRESTVGHNITMLSWIELPNAPWLARSMPCVVAYKDRVFMFGGAGAFGAPPLYSDAWSTADGTHWDLLAATSPWPARSCHPAVAHQGKIRMMGGCQGYTRFNDVWETRDGIIWRQLTANAGWSKRCCFPAVVHDGAIVISGGHDEMAYRNDVWRSLDGASWEQLTEAAPWHSRDGHAAVSWGGNQIVIMGGHDGRKDEYQWHGDVWSSMDGVAWTPLSRAAEFAPRDGAFAAMFNGSLIQLGGFAGSSFYRDFWQSDDGGRHWMLAETASPWIGRAFFGAAPIREQLLIFAGVGPGGQVRNDVWLGTPSHLDSQLSVFI